MAGRRQEAAWLAEWRRAGRPSTWEDQFIPAGPHSIYVVCRTCGCRGLPGLDRPHPWQVGCLIGHKDTCETCGAPTNRLYQHQHCKLGHVGCCAHTDTQWRRLQALLG